jgi:hypothetical protein
MRNATMADLIKTAYNVIAKAAPATSPENLRLMLQWKTRFRSADQE